MAEPFPVTSKEKREECTGAVLGLAKKWMRINGKGRLWPCGTSPALLG